MHACSSVRVEAWRNIAAWSHEPRRREAHRMPQKEKRPLYISYAGPTLLETPLLSKGSAFTAEERLDFNLIGLLPHTVETIEEQAARAYRRYRSCETPLDKHIFLRGIQDSNETLFHRLLEEHLKQAMKQRDRKSTRLNSSHVAISYAGFCLKQKNTTHRQSNTTNASV